jgi:hypothetical protein
MLAHPLRPARAALLALALAAGCGAAWAQQPSAAAIAMAKELIAVKGGTALYEPIVPGVIEQARRVLLQSNPTLATPLNEVAARLRAEYANRGAELINRAARLFASRFTEQELKDALAFYKSPLGRKMVIEEPKILDQSLKETQDWANRLSEEVINRFRVEMKKKGHEI